MRNSNPKWSINSTGIKVNTAVSANPATVKDESFDKYSKLTQTIHMNVS